MTKTEGQPLRAEEGPYCQLCSDIRTDAVMSNLAKSQILSAH